MILSSYVPMSAVDGGEESDADFDNDAKSTDTDGVEGVEDDSVVDEAEQEGVAEMKAARPDMGDMFGDEEDAPAEMPSSDSKTTDLNVSKPEETEVSGKDAPTENGDHKESELGSSDNPISEASEDLSGYATPPEEAEDDDNTQAGTVNTAADTVNTEAETVKSTESHPRQRFRDKLSDLQIEEAKATGRAQLGLAFEILTMMKKRDLKADPEAYQALIDACGRVGDTKRATELLAKMHEDGIVADGVVYAWYVVYDS
jgi:pentatricopeptide repeat protein